MRPVCRVSFQLFFNVLQATIPDCPTHPQMFAGHAAVVQFAQDVDTRLAVAIKFFVRDADFTAEADMLMRRLREDDGPSAGGANAHFARFVPHAEALRSTRGRARAAGVLRHALPPCVAMERGQSLQDWAARTDLRGAAYASRCCEVCHHCSVLPPT